MPLFNLNAKISRIIPLFVATCITISHCFSLAETRATVGPQKSLNNEVLQRITIDSNKLNFTPLFHRGTSDGGGGNGFSSTKQDVQNAISHLKNNLEIIMGFNIIYFNILDPERIADPQLREALKIMNKPVHRSQDLYEISSLHDDLRNTQFVLEENCFDQDGKDADASTKFHKTADICLSASRLIRYPTNSLNEEIIALTFHELTHHFGFAEEVANKLQYFMKPQIKDILSVFENREKTIAVSVIHPGSSAKRKTPNGDVSIHCYEYKDVWFGSEKDQPISVQVIVLTPGQDAYVRVQPANSRHLENFKCMR